MHNRRHMVVRGGGRRGLDIHNQVGRVRVTGFREVDVVPDSLQMALGAVARSGTSGEVSWSAAAGISTTSRQRNCPFSSCDGA